MIAISAATAIMIYLSVSLAILLASWGYYQYKSRNKKVVISKEELFMCEFCHFAYLENRAKKVTKCPACHSFNKDNRFCK